MRTLPIAIFAVSLALAAGTVSCDGGDDWRATLTPRLDKARIAAVLRSAGVAGAPDRRGIFDAGDPAASGMVLTFYDEFDDLSVSSDGAADKTRWTDHQWWEQPTGTADLGVHDGVLDMVISKKNGKWDVRSLSSVNAQGRGFAQRFGYFEARIKLPALRGSWGAFWAMSLAHATKGTAASEIDMLESHATRRDRYWGTLHSNSGSAADRLNVNNHEIVTGGDLSRDFHTFGTLWPADADHVTFYFDGKAMTDVPKYDTTDSSPMMIFLNLLTYPSGPGGPEAAVTSPQHMLVDYVRIWQFPDQLN